MPKKYIFSYLFLTFFGITTFYISGYMGFIKLIISLFLYSLITYVFYFSWKKIRKKEYMNYENYINLFLYKVNSLLFLLLLIIGGFGYYQNELYPAQMPTITISNGKKEVIFQAMSHIGTQDFYNNVRKNIIEAKKRGFVYFFEGVKEGKPESSEQFDKAIGIKFDKDLYKNFSKIYGVVYQDNNYFLGLGEKNCNSNYCDFNIDLNMDEIMGYYNNKMKSQKEINNKQGKMPIDINSEIINSLNNLNDKELKILVFVNKSLLNLIIKSDKIQNLITTNFSNTTLFDVILNKRNEVLSKEIIESKYDKIIITYGLLHFDGVFDLLKKDDSNWKIIKKEVLYPIR